MALAAVQPSAGAAARASSRRRGRVRNDDLPLVVRLRVRGDFDRGPELDQVEVEWILLGVEIEDETRAGLEREAVQPPVEELAAVQSPVEELRDLAPKQRGAGEHRRVAVELLRGDVRAVRELERYVAPLLRHLQVELHDVVACERGRVRDHGCAARRRLACRREGFVREVARDLLRFRKADEDLRGDGIGRAAADRVVRGVLDHAAPCELQELAGPAAPVERRERLRVALEPALGARRRRLHVDPCGRDVHEHVRAGARPHLARPRCVRSWL